MDVDKEKEPPLGEDAFTLIEMLISIMVLSLMLSLATVALRSLVDSWDRLKDPYPRKAIVGYRLQAMISSIFPYVVIEENNNSFYADKSGSHYFFLGGEKECEFITMSPFYEDGLSVAILYQKDDQLVMDETQLYSGKVNYLNPKAVKSDNPIVLFDDVESLQFSYKYKGGSEKTPWLQFPSEIHIAMRHKDGTNVQYSYFIKSNYLEKMQAVQLTNQNV